MKKTIISVCFLLVICMSSNGQEKKNANMKLDEVYNKSVEAFNSKKYPEYEKLSYELLQFAPEHPTLIYEYAKALALNNKTEKSIKQLNKIIKCRSQTIF